MISPDTIIQVYNILKSFKEAYDEYAGKVEECEITLRMLTQLMDDRAKVSTLNPHSGIGKELRGVFDSLKRSVMEFDVSVNGVDDEDDSLRTWDTSSNETSLGKKVAGTAKSFARKALTVAMAKGKATEMETLTQRMKNILRMVDLETSTAQARSLAIMSGQGASDLMTNTVPAAKAFWTTNFLNKMEVPLTAFLHALNIEFGQTLSLHLGNQLENFMRGLGSLLDGDGDGMVDVREYARLVDVSKYPQGAVPQTLLDVLVSQISTFTSECRGLLAGAMLGGHVQRIQSIERVSHRLFATYDQGGDVKFWSRSSLSQTLELVSSLRVASRVVTAVGGIEMPLPNTVVLGTDNGLLKMFDVHSKTGVGALTPHDDAIVAIQGVPCKALVCVASRRSNDVVVHNAATKTVVAVLSAHTTPVVSLDLVSITPSAASSCTAEVHLLATGSSDGEVRLWDTDTLACRHVISLPSHGDRLVRLLVWTAPFDPSYRALFVWHRRAKGNQTLNFVSGYVVRAVNSQAHAASDVDPTIFTVERLAKDGQATCCMFSRSKLGRSMRVADDQKIVGFDVCNGEMLLHVQDVGKTRKKAPLTTVVWLSVWTLEENVEAADDDEEEEETAAETSVANKSSKSDVKKEDEEEEEEEGVEESGSEAFTRSLGDDGSIVLKVKSGPSTNISGRLTVDDSVSAVALIDSHVLWASGHGLLSRCATVSSLTCRKGHDLVLDVRVSKVVSSDARYCDACRKADKSGSMMRCAPCNFSVCLPCWTTGRTNDERNEVGSECYVAHGNCPVCRLADKKFERIKIDPKAEAEECKLCDSRLVGTSAYHCGTCDYVVCLDCRIKGLSEAEDVDAVKKQQVVKRSEVDASAAACSADDGAHDDKSRSTAGLQARRVIFGGTGVWAGHCQLRANSAHSEPLRRPMCITELPRGEFLTAFGGRSLHRWSSDCRLTATESVFRQDDCQVLGGWSFVPLLTHHRLPGQYPVQQVEHPDEESSAPCITVLFSFTRQQQRVRSFTFVGTDCGHVGVFDVNGKLHSSYQLLSTTGSSHGEICSLCRVNPLPTFESRLAGVCVDCTKALPYRTTAISVKPLRQGLWGWMPPQGALSCLPGLSGWRHVYVSIPEVGRVSYIAVGTDETDSSVFAKVPLTCDSVIKDVSCKYLIAKGSPDVCVCGLSVFTPDSDACSAVATLPKSALLGGSALTHLVLGFTSQVDYEILFRALGDGQRLSETSPCVRCSEAATRSFHRRLTQGGGTNSDCSSDTLPCPPTVQQVPSCNYFCKPCAALALEEKRVDVVSVACNEHNVFIGVRCVATGSARIVQFSHDLASGPLRDKSCPCDDPAITLWSCVPESITCTADNRLLFSTGTQCPAVLVADTSNPMEMVRGKMISEISPSDDMVEDDVAAGPVRGFSIVASAPPVKGAKSALIVTAAASSISLWEERLRAPQEDAEGPKPPLADDSPEYVQVGSLEWNKSASCGCVSTMLVDGKDETYLRIFAGFFEGGICVWCVSRSDLESNVAPVAELLGHTDAVTRLRMVDSRLVSAGIDNTVHMWALSAIGMPSGGDDGYVVEPVDPAQWDWDWSLIQCSSRKTAAAWAHSPSSVARGAMLPAADSDTQWLSQHYSQLRDFNKVGKVGCPHLSSTLDSWVHLSIEPDSHNWVLETVPAPSETREEQKFIARFYAVCGHFLCAYGANSYQSVDCATGEDGWCVEDRNVALSSGEGITAHLTEAPGASCVSSNDTPLHLSLKIAGCRGAKRGKPVVLGISMLNMQARDEDKDWTDTTSACTKKIVASAATLKADNVVFVQLTGQESDVHVQLPAPWYVSSTYWGELVVVNVTTFPSKVWVNIATHPPELVCVVTGKPDVAVSSADDDAVLTQIDDVDEDDREAYRHAQFTRFPCSVCHELPLEAAQLASSSTTGLALAANRRCATHSDCFCLEAHTSSCCPLCYADYNQLNRRNCYACGRAVCKDCCYVRRALGSTDKTQWPMCVMCDMDPTSRELRAQLESGVSPL